MLMYLNTWSTAGGYVAEGHGTWLVKMSQQGQASESCSLTLLWPCPLLPTLATICQTAARV